MLLGGELSDSEEEIGSKNASERDMQQYIAEPKLRSDLCPFQWWRSRRSQYPLMARLARKYMAVQGTFNVKGQCQRWDLS